MLFMISKPYPLTIKPTKYTEIKHKELKIQGNWYQIKITKKHFYCILITTCQLRKLNNNKNQKKKKKKGKESEI